MKAWLPTDLTQPEIEGMMQDPGWAMQEKADGKHVLAHVEHGRIFGTNRNGEETAIHSPVLRALSEIIPVTIPDGELLHEGPLVLYDLLQLESEDLRSRTYAVRWDRLVKLTDTLGPPIQLIRSAFTGTEKLDLLTLLTDEQAEGVIFKRLDAPYTEGRPVIGGTMRRWKFRKRVDVVVQRRAATADDTRSFDMFAFNAEGEIVSLGSVSARHFYEELEPGHARIAEAEYLYAGPTHHLVQPTLIRFRDDKVAQDCGVHQLVLGKRFRKAS